MTTAQLHGSLQAAIDSVLDVKAFNEEVAQEKKDAAKLANVRQRMIEAMKDVLF